MILSTFGKDRGEYNNFCSKLLKNLGHYSEKAEFYIRSHGRCNILYNWIYNSKEKHKISDQIINKCFEEYMNIGNAMRYGYKCSYDTYNRLYVEPIKITLLDIFDDSMKTIENTLNGETREINIPCRKYICESVKIYEDMHQKYCVNGDSGNKKHENTCSRLNDFKNTYELFFQNKQDLKDKIPSLDDIKNTYMTKCKIYVQEEPVQPANSEERHTLLPLTRPEDGSPQEAESLIPHGDVNKVNNYLTKSFIFIKFSIELIDNSHNNKNKYILNNYNVNLCTIFSYIRIIETFSFKSNDVF
ncbi:hypothetical protein PVNG_02165 [Plasmodium vivax North Korean]|uniref:Variable surface protein n=1 Tax=Plasmodium vivax North Korean TaxID=1035514 RepID=A0A0J9TWR3_PLAVI|nr:hypothetical protein PVNG_02165 [Plasmodium vivax North Korean]